MKHHADLPPLGFVHIPKNAGTSITSAIMDRKLPIVVSDHSYPGPIAAQEIVVLRCPFERFVSAFHYGRKRWPNPVNAQFSSADELAVSAADPDHPKHAAARMEMGNEDGDFLVRNGKPTPRHTVAGSPTAFNWVYEPQSSWLANAPVHRLRQRHLSADFAGLLERLGLAAAAELPLLNGSDAAAPTLSAPARAYLGTIYAADFRYINEHGLQA